MNKYTVRFDTAIVTDDEQVSYVREYEAESVEALKDRFCFEKNGVGYHEIIEKFQYTEGGFKYETERVILLNAHHVSEISITLKKFVGI